MKNKKSAIYNSLFYNNLLAKIRDKYDVDEMVINFEQMIHEILKQEGLEDEMNDFIKYMPSWFQSELKEMYNDND